MRTAEVAYRRALAAQTLADVRDTAERDAPNAAADTRRWHTIYQGELTCGLLLRVGPGLWVARSYDCWKSPW